MMTQRAFREERLEARSWSAHPSTRFNDSMDSRHSFYQSRGVLELQRAHNVPRSTSTEDSKVVASSSGPKRQVHYPTKKMHYNDDGHCRPSKKVKVSNAPSAAATTSGRWTDEEHAAFLRGLSLWGRVWTRYQSIIPTRSPAQVRSHAQKYFLAHNLAGDEEERPSKKAIQRRHVSVKPTPEAVHPPSVLEWKERCLTYLHETLNPKDNTVDQRRIHSRPPLPKNVVRPTFPQFQEVTGREEVTSQQPDRPFVEARPHTAQVKVSSIAPSPKDSDVRSGETVSPPTYNDMDELMALQALGLLRSQSSRPPTLQCRSISE